MNIKTVKADLDEIKYYYANQVEFDTAAQSIGESSVMEKVRKYNAAIVAAPAALYKLYVSLYVNGSSQLEYALDIDRCADSVCNLNKKLYAYFANYFSE
ncbi:MAG: hypothetical protein NC184_05350 [Roseburia sp.]|nr:hypothetical protein [Roseburia sp.]